MLIEFIGGKLDGTKVFTIFPCDIAYIPDNSDGVSRAGAVLSFSDIKLDNVDNLIYRRKPSTNKFYFDKIEEV